MGIQDTLFKIEQSFNLASAGGGYVAILLAPDTVRELEASSDSAVGVSFVATENVELDEAGLVTASVGGRVDVDEYVRVVLFEDIKKQTHFEARLI